MKLAALCIFSIICCGCSHPESGTYERRPKANTIENHAASGYSVNEIDELKSTDRDVLPMEVQNGVRYIWVEINGIKLKFIFDTGASSICISSAEAVVLLRQGLLREEDFIGSQYFQDATGRISEGTKINLREVKIGNVVLEDIEATVIDNINAPLLLGQTVFERFGSIEIDNANNEIIFK